MGSEAPVGTLRAGAGFDDLWKEGLREKEKASTWTARGFYASSLGMCFRKRMFERLNVPKKWTDDTLKTFLVGKAIHAAIQENFPADAVIAKEESVYWNKMDLRGRFDLLFRKSGGLYVAEIKTVHPFKFKHIKKALEGYDIHWTEPIVNPPGDTGADLHHIMQGMFYIYRLQQDYPELQTLAIPYYARDNLACIEFHYDFDMAYVHMIEQEMTTLLGFLDKSKKKAISLPPAAPNFEWECKYCGYREYCGCATVEDVNRCCIEKISKKKLEQ